MVDERQRLEQSIAVLETQRETLGDVVVDTMIAAARKQLAEMIPAGNSTTNRQRKLVTILFADVVNSTPIGEQLDPEDVLIVMDGGLRRFGAVVERHGGMIGRFMGDSLVAFFGVPTARENDPERAVQAALAIVQTANTYAELVKERWGIDDFSVRVGLNTGLVVIGEVGGAGQANYTAMGDAVNLASRMETAAPPGGILISHETYQHVRGIFDVSPLAPVAFKGKTEPVQVYMVTGVKPRAFRMGTRGIEGIETRMIGREEALQSLVDVFYAVLHSGTNQFATVVGDSGIGKSRLLYEFENWLELQPVLVRYFKGRAHQATQNAPYALLRDLIAFRFQIQESDPAWTVRDKLEQGLEPTLGEDGVMKAHIIGQLLGYDLGGSPYTVNVRDDPQQLRDRALIYLTEFFTAIAENDPVVIFLEDIHWADDSSLGVIDFIIRTTGSSRVLLVALTRPGLYTRRPNWGEEHPQHTTITLNPLSTVESDQLVKEILQKLDQLPDQLRELVRDGAEGNPYYVEELIKMLIEDGVILTGDEAWQLVPGRLADIRVPPTLTGILQARLDSLPPAERETLQQAAVIGRLFWDSAIIHVSQATGASLAYHLVPPRLDILQNRELIFPRTTSSFADTTEYIFKHTILREVTYESVLRRQRRIYHGLIADWLIEQSRERAGEYIGLIADHLVLAEDTERAITYLHRAGEQAANQYANDEAINYFSRALSLLEGDDKARRYELLLARERVHNLVGHRHNQQVDLTALQELVAQWHDGQYVQRQAVVSLRFANFALMTGDGRAAIEAVQTALPWARATKNTRILARAHRQWGAALVRERKLTAARAQLERALNMAQTAELPSIEADALLSLGTLCWFSDDPAGSTTYYERAQNIFQRLGDRRGEASVLNNLSAIFYNLGDFAEARNHFLQALSVYRLVGYRWGQALVLNNLGIISFAVGDYMSAQSTYQQALAIYEAMGDYGGAGLTLANLGIVAHRLGDNETGRVLSQQALEIGIEQNHQELQGAAYNALGNTLAGLERWQEAGEAYQRAVDVRRKLSQTILAMESLAGLGLALLAQDKQRQAKVCIDEVLQVTEKYGLQKSTEPFRLQLICYQVLSANNDERAVSYLEGAFENLQERASKISDDTLSHSFLYNVPANRAIVVTWASIEATHLRGGEV